MQYRKAYADTPSGQIHYAEVAGSGDPIVFIHKTVSTYRMWLPVMERMEPGRRMIAFDMPGFGESFDPSSPVPLAQYGAWLAEAIDALGIARCHIVGHHTGAGVALALATDRPDLPLSLSMIGPLPQNAEEKAESAAKYGTPFTPEDTGQYLFENWNYVRTAGAADIDLANREMSAMLRSWQTRAWTYDAVWQFDFAERYQAVRAPLLIFCSPDDFLFPLFDRSKAMRPDAKAVLLSGGENYQTDRVPGEIAAALSTFLGTREP